MNYFMCAVLCMMFLMHEKTSLSDQISGLIKFQFLFQQMLLLFGLHSVLAYV